MVPDLDAVDGVLPQDVAAGAHRAQRVEVGVGNPHGESGVFLAQALARLDGGAEEVPHIASQGELHQAQHQRDDRDDQHKA